MSRDSTLTAAARRSVSFFERVWFGGLLLFCAFGLGAAALFFAIPLRASVLGATLVRLAVATWLLAVIALAVARWKSFRLPSDESPLETLRARRPVEADEMSVWRWTRVSAWAAAAWAILALIAVIVGRLGWL